MSAVPLGECYSWAWKFLKENNNGILVHGTIIDPWDKKKVQHAWVELDDLIYDWQTVVARQAQPLTVEQFNKVWQPFNTQRYSKEEALLNLVRNKNYGPWLKASGKHRAVENPSPDNRIRFAERSNLTEEFVRESIRTGAIIPPNEVGKFPNGNLIFATWFYDNDLRVEIRVFSNHVIQQWGYNVDVLNYLGKTGKSDSQFIWETPWPIEDRFWWARTEIQDIIHKLLKKKRNPDSNIRQLERIAFETEQPEDIFNYWNACLRANILPRPTTQRENLFNGWKIWYLTKPTNQVMKYYGVIWDLPNKPGAPELLELEPQDTHYITAQTFYGSIQRETLSKDKSLSDVEEVIKSLLRWVLEQYQIDQSERQNPDERIRRGERDDQSKLTIETSLEKLRAGQPIAPTRIFKDENLVTFDFGSRIIDLMWEETAPILIYHTGQEKIGIKAKMMVYGAKPWNRNGLKDYVWINIDNSNPDFKIWEYPEIIERIYEALLAPTTVDITKPGWWTKDENRKARLTDSQNMFVFRNPDKRIRKNERENKELQEAIEKMRAGFVLEPTKIIDIANTENAYFTFGPRQIVMDYPIWDREETIVILSAEDVRGVVRPWTSKVCSNRGRHSGCGTLQFKNSNNNICRNCGQRYTVSKEDLEPRAHLIFKIPNTTTPWEHPEIADALYQGLAAGLELEWPEPMDPWPKKAIEQLKSRNPTNIWYHGSPYQSQDFLKQYESERGALFLTPSLAVAKQYAQYSPEQAKTYQAGFRPKKAKHLDKPTIYSFKVNLNPNQIFDTRKSEHRELLEQIRKEYNKTVTDPDDFLPKTLTATTHAISDASIKIEGDFVTYGYMLVLKPLVMTRGFKGMYFSEGSQGISLAIFDPKQDVELINAAELRRNPDERIRKLERGDNELQTAIEKLRAGFTLEPNLIFKYQPSSVSTIAVFKYGTRRVEVDYGPDHYTPPGTEPDNLLVFVVVNEDSDDSPPKTRKLSLEKSDLVKPFMQTRCKRCDAVQYANVKSKKCSSCGKNLIKQGSKRAKMHSVASLLIPFTEKPWTDPDVINAIYTALTAPISTKQNPDESIRRKIRESKENEPLSDEAKLALLRTGQLPPPNFIRSLGGPIEERDWISEQKNTLSVWVLRGVANWVFKFRIVNQFGWYDFEPILKPPLPASVAPWNDPEIVEAIINLLFMIDQKILRRTRGHSNFPASPNEIIHPGKQRA